MSWVSFVERSYWIPGAYAPPWSEKRTSLLKAIAKEGLQGGKGDSNWIGRHRHIHDPGIQQEPRHNSARVAQDAERWRALPALLPVSLYPIYTALGCRLRMTSA